MEEIRILREMTAKTAPGRSPDYTPAHILYALDLLSNERMGRKQLAENLRIGEGTMRTILSRLSEKDFLVISRPGIKLSDEGAAFLDSIRNNLFWGSYPSSELTVAEKNHYVLIKGASEGVRYGVEQRDQALIHGAVGATTLIKAEGCWHMPGVEEKVESVAIDTDTSDGDVLIIGSGEDEFTARHGALSAALDLLG